MLPRSAKPIVFFLLVLLATSLSAWGQSWAGRARLQGSVKDESGKPIAGATVTFRPGTGQVDPKADGPKTLTTDKNGKWSILGLAGGPWGVLIQKDGYTDSQGQINAQEYSVGVPQPINIVLKAPSKEAVQQAQAQQQPSTGSLAKQAIEKGNALLADGKYADARASYEEGMSKLDDKSLHPAIYRAIADSYYKEGKPDPAIDTLKKALEIAPDDPDTLKLIVTLLAASNREAEAKTYMAKLPQGTQMDPAIGLNLGIKRFNEGKMDEALKEFNDVVAANPNLPDVYYYRAMVYLNKQQNAPAKADLQKLLELDPNNKFAKDAKDFLKELK
ncbi:MAG TPA: tetratricopeptide repeat protein [Thermoanaerobaculia bacterium]|jgi:tetratricopeptide (TPR) repeat protein|nr:tetratricopeptide repeat protein [Thermoanaerobaculia bacterium]